MRRKDRGSCRLIWTWQLRELGAVETGDAMIVLMTRRTTTEVITPGPSHWMRGELQDQSLQELGESMIVLKYTICKITG